MPSIGLTIFLILLSPILISALVVITQALAMDADICNELMEKLCIQSSSSSTSEKTPIVDKCIDQVPCDINIFSDLIPMLAHDYCNSTTFHDWRKQIQPVTEAFRVTCESKEEAMNLLNIERESLLEQLWWEKEQFQRLQLARVTEERNWQLKEAELENKLFWKRVQFAGCRKALQDVQEQFDEYKGKLEPLEEPEWFVEFFKDEFH